MEKDKIISILEEENIEEAEVYATFYDKVCLGTYRNGQIYFDKPIDYALCLCIVVFNSDKEIRFIPKNGRILTRKITEEEGMDYFDEAMYLNDGSQDKMIVRNYLTTDENNQVIVGDYRLVGRIAGDKEEIG